MSTAAAAFAIVSILLLGPAMHERFGTHSMSAGPWIAFRLFVLSASLPGCGGLDECSPGAQAGSILGVECLGRLAEAVVETVKALGVTMATPTGVVSTGLVGICALHHSRYASCLRVQLAHLFCEPMGSCEGVWHAFRSKCLHSRHKSRTSAAAKGPAGAIPGISGGLPDTPL